MRRDAYTLRKGDALLVDGDVYVVLAADVDVHFAVHVWLQSVRDQSLRCQRSFDPDEKVDATRIRGGRYTEDEWRQLIANDTGARPY